MDELSLVKSFNDSLGSDTADIIGEFAELGLDSIMDDGILKEIPFVSTAISMFHIGKSIKERYHIRKMIIFLNEINNHSISEEKRVKYKEKILSDEKKRNQELEYLMVVIDRYLSYDKPKMLAKLYLAYLDDRISWIEFLKYSEVIDRFLHGDCEFLINEHLRSNLKEYEISDIELRLSGLGLRYSSFGNTTEVIGSTLQINDPSTSYGYTPFGYQLKNILSDY